MSTIPRFEIDEVFCDTMFAQATGPHYAVPEGWYPLPGLTGSLDIQANAVLFCRLGAPVEALARKYCHNGVLQKLRIQRSARIDALDTVLVLASDLLREFALCQVPVVHTARELSGRLSGRASSGIAAEKVDAYYAAHYRFADGPETVTLQIDHYSPALARLFESSGQHCGVFITAYNPHGKVVPAADNDSAHAILGSQLALSATRTCEGAGFDPSGGWPEEKSFFGLGIGLDQARKLGIQFRQDAVVWADANAVPRLILLR